MRIVPPFHLGAGNQVYVPELDRIVLKAGVSKRPFASTASCRKACITTRILGIVHELCTKGIHVTKRDLFYTDAKLFVVRWGCCGDVEGVELFLDDCIWCKP